ncbi:MarR family transcriptional regulator [Microbacterium kribbense]|uniref:MarR family transcriptional regulator n=1 Tax=Microbacterium kribbense TaxID=433645 RepID=A0ABP7GMS3_9MICO
MTEEQRPAAEASELEALFPVSYAIYAMARTHRAIAAAQLSRLGLFPNQEIMLIQLAAAPDGLSQKVLVDALKVSHPTVAKTVARLEKTGLVRRRASDEDKRISVVSLTAAGRRLHDDVIAVWRGLNEQTVAGLSAQETAAFVATAQKIRGALETAAPPL